jgi:serine/threonine-protein kinase RsbW
MVRRMATGAPRDPSRLPTLFNGLRWRRVFPGEERQLAALRRWLAELLPPCSARDDLATVATELGSNAIKHTGSGRPGGWFTVEITWHEATVMLAVADHGGLTEPQVVDNPDGERGRGLLMVKGLSGRTGFAGDERGRLVWAQVTWTGVDASGPPSQDPYESAVRDDEVTLARRLAGVPAWFGRSTLMWWALAGPRGLVSAPTAQELARLLGDSPDATGTAEFRSTGHIPRRVPGSWPVRAHHCQPAVRGLNTLCQVPDRASASSGRRTHMLVRLVRFPAVASEAV